MTEQDDTRRKSRRDLLLILLILPFSVLCMFMAGQAAIRLAPTWAMPANMLSNLDPNASFAGMGGRELLEPLNPGILTQPVWDSIFLTPNVTIPTREIVETPTSIPVQPTQPPREVDTPVSTPSPTATFSGPIVLPTKESRFADLAINKSDNSNTYTPGTTVLYTIVVSNRGPDDVSGFIIADNVPAGITGLTVNCTPSSNCGANSSSGDNILFEGASLRANNQFNITVSGQVHSGATGNLSNTATIHIPSVAMIEDLNGSNNSSTDTDTRLAISDLAITKSDGSNTYAANNPITYTIVVTNSGPSDALGVRVEDNISSQVASWDWACTTQVRASGCNGVTGSTSNFTDTGLNIQVGGRIVYTVTAYLPATAYLDTSSISNSASILLPGSPNFRDPNLSNNTSVDTDMPYIDLQITKDDGGATFTPNGTVGYTVTVTNNSTFNLTGVTVADTKPAQFTEWQWCVSPPCPAPINTDFMDTINLDAKSSQIYNVTATVSGNPELGNITNTATVSPSVGLVDADTTNNSATETTPPYIDLAIDKDDFVDSYIQGGSLQYIVTVTNNSGFDLTGITVTDTKPALISSWSWTCTPDPGPPPDPTCTAGPSDTNINDTITLPAGRYVTYTIDAVVSTTATGTLTNSATVTSSYTGAITATDTDSRLIEYVSGPPDGGTSGLSEGNSVDFALVTPITIVGNTSDYEIVYYELGLVNNTIDLDQVIISIGNGTNWYVVYYWGDNLVDNNASPPGSTSEPDNYSIPTSLLYGSPYQTGILIDADGGKDSPPPGTYQFIRVTAPTGDSDGGLGFDTIGVWP